MTAARTLTQAVVMAVAVAVASAWEEEAEVPWPVCWAELLAVARAVAILVSKAAACTVIVVYTRDLVTGNKKKVWSKEKGDRSKVKYQGEGELKVRRGGGNYASLIRPPIPRRKGNP